jgi:glucose-1-phosphate thymidylyltransferase
VPAGDLRARGAPGVGRSLDVDLKGVITPTPAAARTDADAGGALLRVGNWPILCHALEALRHAGAREVAVCVSARELAAVRACLAAEAPGGLEIEYVPHVGRSEALEGALHQAAAWVGEAPCILHAANGLLAQPLKPLAAQLRADALDLVVPVQRRAGNGGSIGLATRRLLRLAGEVPGECELEPVGICAFGPGALRHAAGTRWWQGGELDLAGVAERLAPAGGRVRLQRVHGWRRYGGTAADLLELNRMVLEALAAGTSERAGAFEPGPRPTGMDGADSRIEGCVTIDPSASVHASMIVGPAIVGPGAVVEDSYIGPYTSIGAGALIEGAEVERSIILPRARIQHIGGRLVGSVVGQDTRVFRDFSLPRALRLHVGDGGEVALC